MSKPVRGPIIRRSRSAEFRYKNGGPQPPRALDDKNEEEGGAGAGSEGDAGPVEIGTKQVTADYGSEAGHKTAEGARAD